MSRLKILASTFTCCPPGKPGFTGGEDLLGWNMLSQIARYHDVWAITNSEDRSSVEAGAREIGLENIHFHYVGLPRWLSPFLRFQGTHQLYYFVWQILAWLASRRLHKEIQFDLFHHITYANDWMASFIGAFLAIPYVRGPGGGAHRTPKGFESEYNVGGRIWEKVRSVSQWILRHDPVFVKGQSRSSAILVCNKESATEISKRWSAKVEMFPVSGISMEDLATPVITNSTNKFRVLTAGSLIRVKGFGLAIKAFEQFARQNPDSEFGIVGSGPEEARLRDLASRSDASSKIQFLGELPREQLLSEMAASDVFLFPSLRDGGGTVVIEAMGVGKPVICLDTGGPGMHIDQQCGVKIVPQSPAQAISEMASALERLCRDENLRVKLGQAAKQKVVDLYLWEKLGDKLNKIYERALGAQETNESD